MRSSSMARIMVSIGRLEHLELSLVVGSATNQFVSRFLFLFVALISTDEQLVQVIIDLFSAGMETIKTTLQWINVFMLRNPKDMRRVQDELDQVVGRHRLPTIEDLQYLPITESTILESMRRSSIVPLATTHSPTR